MNGLDQLNLCTWKTKNRLESFGCIRETANIDLDLANMQKTLEVEFDKLTTVPFCCFLFGLFYKLV